MKKLFVLRTSAAALLISFVILFVAGCSKDDSQPILPSKEYRLYNYSSGSPVDAGSFTIQQLQDSSASLTIRLSSGFLAAGITFQASLAVVDTAGTELIYANLSDVDGTTGVGTTNPVRASDNSAITYSDLILKQGYYVKVMNGTNVQAKGIIQ